MTDALFRRWLKVMDPTALTARETLQRALGYGRTVRDVSRSELFAFRWEDGKDARGFLERLAGSTNLLQNPNKHRFEVAVGDERLAARGNVWVLVATPGAGEGMEDVLSRHRLASGEIPRVRRAVLWELDLEEGGDLRELAGEMAVTRSRTRGLLANPHVEDVAVFDRPPSAREVAEGLVFEGREAAG